MTRTEAVRILARAGRLEEARQVIDSQSEQAERSFQAIRSDRSRTEDWKRWSLAVASRRADEAVTEKLVRMAQTAATDDRDDAERVFGVKGLSGDAATLVISRRDAGDRVAKVQRSGELRDLLDRATRSGDEVLARAVAERAVETDDAKTLEKFLTDRPHLDKAGERLWNAQRAQGDTLLVTVGLMGLRPAELHDMRSGSIEELAGRPEPGTT